MPLIMRYEQLKPKQKQKQRYRNSHNWKKNYYHIDTSDSASTAAEDIILSSTKNVMNCKKRINERNDEPIGAKN